jgi:NRAMP (natural resistance-associated macrophage protein)-like metal ion transporter
LTRPGSISQRPEVSVIVDTEVPSREMPPQPSQSPQDHQSQGPVLDFFADLGPGLITGAADDDPSGIATYSITGAAFGYGLLWMALFSFPLMSAVQMMCSRLGMVTGRGLASVVRKHYPRWVLWCACLLLIVANVINIGADLGGMADAMSMMTGVRSLWWVPVFGGFLVAMLLWTSYRVIARIFKWLTLVLFAYVIAAFLAKPDWRQVLQMTFVPRIQWSRQYLSVFVGILGTTISPYLFFWQSAQEVEEERAEGKNTLAKRQGATDEELRRARRDVITGMFFSNFVMYFIILTTAATLHAHGVTKIATARQAAEALRPLAGDGAYLLFTLGLIGTGMLGVPVLAGSSAYAISEAMAWGASLDCRPKVTPKFYGVLAAAIALGVGLDYAGLDAVQMLFWSAVVNGVLAPPLIVLVVLLTSDRSLMGDRVSPPLLKWLGWITAGVMTTAAVAMFVRG